MYVFCGSPPSKIPHASLKARVTRSQWKDGISREKRLRILNGLPQPRAPQGAASRGETISSSKNREEKTFYYCAENNREPRELMSMSHTQLLKNWDTPKWGAS